MANITMTLDTFNDLMALGQRRRRAVFADLMNTGRVKNGQAAVSLEAVEKPEGPTVAAVKAAINAAA